MDLGERTKHDFSSANSDDDDDAPLIFKRNAAPSKHGQLGSASIKASSQKRDAPSGGATSDRLNGQTSKSQKVKVPSTANVSAEKHTKASPSSLASQSRHSSVNNKAASNDIEMTHLDRSRGQTEDSDDSDDGKPLSARLNPASATTQKCSSVHSKQPLKQAACNKSENNYANKIVTGNSYGVSHNSREFVTESAAQKVEEDDSEDDKPLSSKFQSKSSACVSTKKLSESGEDKPLDATRALKSPLQTSSSFQKMKANDQKDPSDSDDDKPLVSRKKSINGASTKKYESDEEKKPLASKHKLNGSSKKDSGTETTSSKLSHKRPLADGNNSTESLKKAKTADASAPVKIKHESVIKEELKADEDDHIPISQRLKKPASSDKQSSTKKVNKVVSSSFKKEQKTKKIIKNTKYSKSMTVPPGSGGGQKWTTLEHSGVIFPPPYKPHGVKMLYNGQPVDLTPEEEEVATMFAVMKDTDYASKPKFIENFMNDWRQVLRRNHVIRKFELCDFTPIYDWHQKEKEKKKQMTSEEKKAVKEEKLKLEDKYMWAIVDGVKEKVGNFRVEPPGLFRGRGEHPKMGKLKKRIRPRDITINIGKHVPIPECPIEGERWKEVRHDNTVTWLAYWNDPINIKEFKYVFLAASSSLKGQSDKEKYEKARLLKDYIQGIRATYTRNFSSNDATKRQISVATYLIDKLALRAGNEKDDDEADTVGCCTLKVENVVLVPPNNLQFDFLGKDSIRYFNTVEVELPVYQAIGDFRTARKSNGEKKRDNDDLFDMLDTSKLNAHLKELMPGLTAKVFRTYNASITLDEMLSKKTTDGTLPEKIAVYQHANKEVAIICNHQRSVSKSHDAQMSRLNEKIDELKAQQEELKIDLSRAKKGKPPLKDAEGKIKKNLSSEVLEKKMLQLDAKIEKMELDKRIKEDLKTVALGTSKINYLDPRITVAWCKRKEVPIEKMFNKSLLAKFSWAMDVEPDFRF